MVILLLLWRAEGYHQSAVGHLSPFIHECRTYYLNSRNKVNCPFYIGYKSKFFGAFPCYMGGWHCVDSYWISRERASRNVCWLVCNSWHKQHNYYVHRLLYCLRIRYIFGFRCFVAHRFGRALYIFWVLACLNYSKRPKFQKERHKSWVKFLTRPRRKN